MSEESPFPAEVHERFLRVATRHKTAEKALAKFEPEVEAFVGGRRLTEEEAFPAAHRLSNLAEARAVLDLAEPHIMQRGLLELQRAVRRTSELPPEQFWAQSLDMGDEIERPAKPGEPSMHQVVSALRVLHGKDAYWSLTHFRDGEPSSPEKMLSQILGTTSSQLPSTPEGWASFLQVAERVLQERRNEAYQEAQQEGELPLRVAEAVEESAYASVQFKMFKPWQETLSAPERSRTFAEYRSRIEALDPSSFQPGRIYEHIESAGAELELVFEGPLSNEQRSELMALFFAKMGEEARVIAPSDSVQDQQGGAYSTWNVTTDGSVKNFHPLDLGPGLELTTPVIRTPEDQQRLRRICDALQAVGVSVDETTGCHKHIYEKGLLGPGGFEAQNALLRSYAHNEALLNNYFAPHRRVGGYGGAAYLKHGTAREHAQSWMAMEEKLNSLPLLSDEPPGAISPGVRAMGSTGKKCKINFGHLASPIMTTEFRQPEGSLDADRILSEMSIFSYLARQSALHPDQVALLKLSPPEEGPVHLQPAGALPLESVQAQMEALLDAPETLSQSGLARRARLLFDEPQLPPPSQQARPQIPGS